MTEANKKLEEVHINLWGPHHPVLFSGKMYTGILLDIKIGKIWVVYLQSKDKFVDVFQVWLPKIENESGKFLKMLRTNNREEFILAKLKDFYNQTRITIKYTEPYIHKENGLTKRGWRTIMIIKDSMLIDNHLLLEF